MLRSRFPVVLVGLVVLSTLGDTTSRPGSAQDAPYRVVVNAASGISSLKRAQLAAYMLKRATTWPDGTSVTVVDLSTTSPARAAVSREILGKSIEAVVHYWQGQMFSGRATPPPVKSEAETLALVASVPGAIGYVGGAGVLPSGVKQLLVAD